MVRIRGDIEKFFSEPEAAEKSRFLMSALLDNIHKVDSDLAKRAASLIGLAFIFELLQRTTVSGLSLAGFQITDLSLIEKALPVIVTYLNFSCWTLVASRRIMEDVFDAFVEQAFPNLWNSDIEAYLRPPHFVKTYAVIRREVGGTPGKLLTISVAPILLALGFAIPVFSIYAYYSLFRKFESDIVLMASACFSTFFVVQVFLLMVGVNRATREQEATSAHGS